MEYFCTNVFNLCVKISQYFRTDNISLESTIRWLSDDAVNFEVDITVREKYAKM